MIQYPCRFDLQVETWIEILDYSVVNRLRMHASASSIFILQETHRQLPSKGRISACTHPAESKCRIRPPDDLPQCPQKQGSYIRSDTRSRSFAPIGESAPCCTDPREAAQCPPRSLHSAHTPCRCRRQSGEMLPPSFRMCRLVRRLESALHPAHRRPSPRAADRNTPESRDGC